MWDSGSRRLAVSHPRKLRYSLHLPTVSVCCQSAHRRGNHHNGDRLPGLRRRRQGEPAPAAQRKYRPVPAVWGEVRSFMSWLMRAERK